MARLTAAAKRERQRVDHLVLGKPRPKPQLIRPAGMPKQQWKIERREMEAKGATLEPGVEEAVRRRELFDHGRGTPETNANREIHHHDCLLQLERNGTIDKEQLEWAAEIANVHRSIESDVAIKIASFETRVDQSKRGPLIAEGVYRVRMHVAYTIWRSQLPAPKQLVLDMIVGDAIGYTVAARRHRVHNRKAKAQLLAALNRWPDCVSCAFRSVSKDEVDRANAA